MNANQLTFTKACGLGNDFVILPLPTEAIDLSNLSIALADRRYGVGCDQVIFTEATSLEKTYNIRFFNADGSEAEGCGNGSRCVAKLLMNKHGWEDIILKTLGGALVCQKHSEDMVSIHMPNPQWQRGIELNNYPISKATYVTVGNPHLVCFVDNIDHIKTIGPILETYLYQLDNTFPKRVNIGFAQIIDKNNIALNVWERGSGFTPACGTGACAAAIAACLEDFTEKQVTIHQQGGILEIHWKDDKLSMKGEARTIYQGVISLNLLDRLSA